MLQGFGARDAATRVDGQQLLQQVDARIRQSRAPSGQQQCGPYREVRVPVLQGGHSRPHFLVGGAQYAAAQSQYRLRDGQASIRIYASLPEYLEELVDLGVSGEQRALGDHLR